MKPDEFTSQDWLGDGVSRRARSVRWSIVACIVLLATLAGAIVAVMRSVGVCGYDYQVTVTSKSKAPIRNVRGMAFHDAEEAQKVAANRRTEFSEPSEEETKFNGKSLRVEGLYTCNSWCLGLINTGAPPRYLVFLIDYEDGKRENKAVEIPPGPRRQRIVVDVP